MSVEMNQVVTDNVIVDNVIVEKEMRTLPGKYSKFAGFAYWLLAQMKDNQILSGDAYDATCNMMHLLSLDFTAQVEFYERYLAEASVSMKLMKTDIKNRLKPATTTKIKKDKDPKEKKVKKEKKEQVNITNNDIIAKLVECANSVMVLQDVPLNEPNVVNQNEKNNESNIQIINHVESQVDNNGLSVVQEKEKKKRVKKEKVEGNVEEGVVEEKEKKKRVKKEKVEGNVEEGVVEEKEKKKRVKKEKVVEVLNLQDDNNKENEVLEELEQELQQEEEEVVLHSVLVDGLEYFYDPQNRLYNTQHSVIGSFDPISLSISIL